MNNLVVYGSLVHKDELLKHGIHLHQVCPIKVQGFQRVFNQEPSYRFVDSKYRAVLNIQECQNFWFNAILIKDLNKEYLDALDEREKGYNKLRVDVTSYEGKVFKECLVYKGKEHLRNDEILANKDYFELCQAGAKSFGEEFYKDYLKTSYKNSSKGLVLI